MITARKRDDNEKTIVDALIAAGAHVDRLNDFGVPDVLVGHRCRTILMEIKNPSKNVSNRHGTLDRIPLAERGLLTDRQVRQLTDKQVDWWRGWDGGPAYVVETPEQALAILRGENLPEPVRAFAGVGWVNLSAEPMQLLSPGQAETLAAALLEMAALARAKERERSKLL